MTGRRWKFRAEEILAGAAGIAVFGLLFVYTGDASLWAVGAGAATSLLFLLAAHLKEPGEPDGSV